MNERLSKNLENYLSYHRIEGSTDSTISYDRRQLRPFLADVSASCESVADITSLNVLEHLGAMKERGLAPKSVRTRWQAIRTWFNWCIDWGLLEVSSAAKIKPPEVPKIRKPFLSEEQFRALIDLCPLNTLLGARRQAMLWLLATSGIRRREMSLLAKADLDWDRGIFRVLHGKGQKERNVPSDRQCQRVMLRYFHQRTDELECVWITEEGNQLTYHGIGQDMALLIERAGLDIQDRCHIFQCTFAANAVRQNIPRPFVQAIAGWSTPQMLDYYVAAMEAEAGAIDAFRDFQPFAR